jgi:hypothetical protein
MMFGAGGVTSKRDGANSQANFTGFSTGRTKSKEGAIRPLWGRNYITAQTEKQAKN